ncbi:MAG: anti-sigma factor [Deltaproteobacteria bacterium]|nr:anti-sigma factor [Deltaproteobacteria bacterium]
MTNEPSTESSRRLRSNHGWIASLLIVGGCAGGDPLGERSVDVPLVKENADDTAPSGATGMARIQTATGRVDITVIGLPPLTGEVYEGWLAGGDEDPTSTGRFQTLADGTGTSTISLGDLTARTFDRVVITVEPEPDPTPKPDPRHAIAGDIP